jgi:riboflavin kinase/FMN adenylyltransferase
MIVIRHVEELGFAGERPVVVTLGNFDGLHLGHRAIVERVCERAEALRGLSAAVTFHPHPLRVVAPDRAPELMLTVEQKLELFEEMGVDAAVVLPFDRSMASMPAEEFVERVLVRGLGVREIYVGPDFRFGKGRSGDVALLRRLGERFGFTAETIGPILADDERISASRIRELLSEGKLRRANTLLGRPFTLIGTVVHGEQRGRELLVPTANLAPENQFLPARGVYFSRTRWEFGETFGLTNIGVRPTFGYEQTTIETYLPGFEGDLYGERIRLELHERHRDERKFPDPQALKAQIEQDIAAFRAWLRTDAGQGPGR